MSRPKTRYTKAAERKPAKGWQGVVGGERILHLTHPMEVVRVKDGPLGLIEFEARLNGEPVGRDRSPRGAQYLAEDALVNTGVKL